MSKKVIVIGSGFSGIAAACHLAAADFEVHILEKNSVPGGRARKYTHDGFVFDMGPSWYWMPDVFEQFFAAFDKKVSDYYELVRLDPSYRIWFGDNDKMDVPADMEALEALFEHYEPGSAQKLRRFLEEAGYKYQVGMQDFVRKPSLSITEFLDWRIVSSLFRLQMFTSISKHVRQLFKHEHLIQLLEFPVLFLGAKPENTPALYSLMNYADLKLGTWYPMGGMHEIVSGMMQLARELGVQIHLNQEVVKLEIDQKSVKRIHTTTGAVHLADVVVGAADYHHIETTLLPHTARNYSDKYWDSRSMAPSCLLYYVGINKRLNNLLHHNLFFDADFNAHARAIYDTPHWPEKPLFYVSAPSVTDPSVAPAGCENLFMLIPVAPGLEDSEAIRDQYFDLIINRLEQRTGQSVRDSIVYKRAYAHRDFVQDYHAFKGNAYGLANTLLQTAFLKPRLKNRHLNNLYYAGQLTVPGPGVPPALISGQVVANEIVQNFK
ncbi:MAG: phytoene desaturase [Bacteroidetes bacterium]|nr:phytoene desaturase [Bacteroidota bacterium]